MNERRACSRAGMAKTVFELMERTVITSSTVVNSVVEKLRAALARGQWRSGDMLPGQRELAEQLGISRPSLREAVIVLETLGLVRSMPGKGVVVLEANLADSQQHDSAVAAASLEDVLQLRYTLEPFIVGLVAQSISSKEVGQLRLTLMDMREALEANDSEAGVSAYIAFHEELFTLTSNKAPKCCAIPRNIWPNASKTTKRWCGRSAARTAPRPVPRCVGTSFARASAWALN